MTITARHGLTMLVLALTLGGSAGAATFTVDSTADAVDANPGDGACAAAGGACTLRAAVQEANALGGANTVMLPAGTYTLTIAGTGEEDAATGDLDLRTPIEIAGAGAASTVVDAAGLDRVFDVWDSATISGLTITGGAAEGGSGGGIISFPEVGTSDLVLDRVQITGNTAAHGGAIFNEQSSHLTITNSSLTGNTATIAGGAIENADDVATLTNVTISGNGGSASDGISNTLAIALEHVTVVGDTVSSGDVSLTATILDNGPGGTSCIGNPNITSGGANVESGNSCGLPTPGDSVDTDPQLGPLQDNGGGTLTHAIGAGSPAVDRVTGTCTVTQDQRGVARPLDGDGSTTAECDAGAYEFDPTAVTTTTVTTVTTLSTTTTSTTLPGGCTLDPTFQALECRVEALSAALTAAGTPGKPLDRLGKKLDAASEKLLAGEQAVADGKAKKAKKQVKKASIATKKVGKKLANAKKGPKVVADEATRGELAGDAATLSLDLLDFRDTL